MPSSRRGGLSAGLAHLQGQLQTLLTSGGQKEKKIKRMIQREWGPVTDLGYKNVHEFLENCTAVDFDPDTRRWVIVDRMAFQIATEKTEKSESEKSQSSVEELAPVQVPQASARMPTGTGYSQRQRQPQPEVLARRDSERSARSQRSRSSYNSTDKPDDYDQHFGATLEVPNTQPKRRSPKLDPRSSHSPQHGSAGGGSQDGGGQYRMQPLPRYPSSQPSMAPSPSFGSDTKQGNPYETANHSPHGETNIVYASFGSRDITSTVRQQYRDGTRIFEANPAVWGINIDPNTYKSLIIVFRNNYGELGHYVAYQRTERVQNQRIQLR